VQGITDLVASRDGEGYSDYNKLHNTKRLKNGNTQRVNFSFTNFALKQKSTDFALKQKPTITCMQCMQNIINAKANHYMHVLHAKKI
jgi:hypothetical protein